MDITNTKSGPEILIPDQVIDELESKIGIQIPYALQPMTNLVRVGPHFYSTDPQIGAGECKAIDFDQFFGRGLDGLYTIGLRHLPRPEFRFSLHRRIRRQQLYLEIVLPEEESRFDDSLRTVNSYLFALAAFLDDAVGRGLDVEIGEVPGYGQYRIHATDGHGVMFDESWLWKTDVRADFGGLIARFGVAMADRSDDI